MLTDNSVDPMILIVEDNDGHAHLIQLSFKEAHDRYRLEIVKTLQDAWIVIERCPPDLILTDYRLPDGDGNKLVVMLKDVCPVILMTSQGNEQVAVTSIKAGALDYIIKSAEAFSTMPQIVKMALREWNLIQERERIYKAVSRGKLEWEQTFDALPDLISIIDTHYTISRVNRAMADRCGFGVEELPGRKCYEVFHGMTYPPDFCPHVLMMQDGSDHSEEIEEKKLGGFFDVTVSPLYNDKGKITACVHVARDITERKNAEEDRQALEKQFQQAQKLESLGELAGGIAHDFNNILTVILGHCYILKDDINSEMSAKDHVRKIEDASNRAAELCRQMLTYSGQSPQVQIRLNLWLLVDEVVKMLTSAIRNNVTIELDLKRDVPEITGDNAQIQQIVMNLIINAAEAIGDKIGTIKVVLKKVFVQAGQSDTDSMGNAISAGSYACLEISDNGCGIDEKTKKRIFEPFFTTKFTGRGLGMSVVLGIIKSHDGALQLTSSPGVGTTFKVYFPLPDKSAAIETTQTAEFVPSAKVSGTVLLVDDEESLRTIGSALLNSLGFSAITASNGREAQEIYSLRKNEVDLILMDMIMPVMGGIDSYRMLREISLSIPIVICSGYSVEGILEEIACDEHAAVIQKPYDPDQLRNTLMKLLEKTGVDIQ